jgi:monofunctional biosynthetic peptidoglycan transglycosylase
MIKKIFKYFGIFIIVFFITSIVLTIFYRWINVPITPLMISRYFDPEIGKLEKEWKSLDEISPKLPLAVVTSEDQKFEDHFGFDLEAIEKAADYNANRQQKMFSCGNREAGLEKDWKFTLHF